MNYKTWVKIENGIISEVYISNVNQNTDIYTLFPNDSGVSINDKKEWYDENNYRINDNELVRLGIRIDNRGRYWNKENYQEMVIIKNLDINIPEGFTNIKPIEGKPCKWENDEWVIDEVPELKRELENIDKISNSGRAIRKAAVDVGNMLTAVRKVAMDFGDMAKTLGVPGFDPDENVALKALIEFDPLENYDLQKITEWESEAETLREKIHKLEDVEIETD